MQTECTTKLFEFEAVDRRTVVAGFDGGDITSNAGGLLLGLVDRGLGLIRRFAKCFRDRRDARYVEHQVETIVGQRIFGLVLGYEDLNDHDELRKDPVIKNPRSKLRGIGGRKEADQKNAASCGEYVPKEIQDAGREAGPGAAFELRGFGRQEHAQSC